MRKLQAIVKKYMVVLILMLVCVFFGVMDPKFLTAGNFIAILRQVSMLGIAAVGVACMMLVGDMNMCAGVLQGLAGVICAMMLRDLPIPVWLAFLITLAICALVGAISGLIIVKTRMPAIIGSLGMRYIVNGGAFLLAGGLPIYGLREEAKWIGQGSVLGIPVPVIVLLLFFVIGYFLLNKIFIGRHLFAVGSNAEAARLSGINVDKVRVFAFTFSSFCSGIAGLILMARNASGQPNGGNGGEMNIITACVVGGVSAMGGTCNPVTLIVGVLVMGVLTNGMTILGISEYWQTVSKGVVLIVAVGFDFYQRTKQVRVKVPAQAAKTTKT